jgi:hypothetical protein
MKRNPLSPTALVVALILNLSSPVLAKQDVSHHAGQVRVMTQNLYVGAEILSIAVAPGLCELMSAADTAVKQVLANDFGQRADVQARLIAEESPEVIGLQEVFTVIESDLQGVPFQTTDYLTVLMTALAGQDAIYNVAAIRSSTPLTVPADSNGDCDPADPSFAAADYLGTIIDHDVILCRSDIVCSAGASANFTTNASATTPAGPIVIERGWVSAIASVKGREYQVVNTHLEVDSNASFRAVQFGQAVELAATLDSFHGNGLPQVVLGDFNSDDATGLPDCAPFVTPCYSGYQVMAGTGFLDTWLKRGGKADDGFTCCQDEDLLNTESNHSVRIDQIWARGSINHFGGPEVRGVRADVVGDEPQDRSFPDGLWPSDHAGVIADLVMRSPNDTLD